MEVGGEDDPEKPQKDRVDDGPDELGAPPPRQTAGPLLCLPLINVSCEQSTPEKPGTGVKINRMCLKDEWTGYTGTE